MTKIIAGRIRYDLDLKIIDTLTLMANSDCRVSGDVIDGDLVNVGCENSSCDGECVLQTQEDGSQIHYWCSCE